MKKRSTTSNTIPQIGMGVTIQIGSDRYPYTIIHIFHNGKRIVIQEDQAVRTDKNGMSESQSYDFSPDLNGELKYASLRKDGYWKLMGSKMSVYIGARSKYYDYSF